MDLLNFEKEFYSALDRKDFGQCGEMLLQNQSEVDSLVTQIDTMITDVKKNQVTLNAFTAILKLHVDKNKIDEKNLRHLRFEGNMFAAEKIRLLSSGDRLAVPSNINKIIVIDLEKGVWQTQNTGHDNNLQVNCNDISVRIYHSCDLFDVTLHYTYSINNTNKIYLNGLQTSMINKLHLLDEETGLAFIMISGTSISACREDNGLCLIIDNSKVVRQTAIDKHDQCIKS